MWEGCGAAQPQVYMYHSFCIWTTKSRRFINMLMWSIFSSLCLMYKPYFILSPPPWHCTVVSFTIQWTALTRIDLYLFTMQPTRYWQLLVVLPPPLRQSGRSHESGVLIFLLKFFFCQNSRSCPKAYHGAGRRRKSPLDGATNFLSTILLHITTV